MNTSHTELVGKNPDRGQKEMMHRINVSGIQKKIINVLYIIELRGAKVDSD